TSIRSQLLLSICLLSFSAIAGAADKTWDGSANNSWILGSNWTPSGVPSSSQTTLFPSIVPQYNIDYTGLVNPFNNIEELEISNTSGTPYTFFRTDGGSRIGFTSFGTISVISTTPGT